MEFVDSLQDGDVVVAVCSDHTAAVWGELLSVAAIARGARGVVVDGLVRDRRRLPEGFSVFARGSVPAESYGRLSLIAADNPVTIGGVNVSPGDLVIGDTDGVVVVPAALADDATERALQKALTERTALSTLRAGVGTFVRCGTSTVSFSVGGKVRRRTMLEDQADGGGGLQGVTRAGIGMNVPLGSSNRTVDMARVHGQ